MMNLQKRSRKSFSVYSLFSLFAVSFLASFFLSNIKNSALNEKVIVLGDDGFVPDVLTINAGTKVVWKVEGKNPHWPASDFHPSHDEYPEGGGCLGSKLDACRPLISGESFSFIFSKTGNFGIHDHLHPGHIMTIQVSIGRESGLSVLSFSEKGLAHKTFDYLRSLLRRKEIVSEPGEIANQAIETCKDPNHIKTLVKGKYKLACYAEEFEKIALEHGQKKAQETLAALHRLDPEAKNCHFIAHGIGWGVYKKNPEDWQDAISNSSPRCAYGEQMGIIEQYAKNLPDGKLEKENVKDLCGPRPKSDCNHSVGHMMLVLSKNDLEKATDLCSSLSDYDQRFMCYQGMIMERFVGGNLREHGIIPESTSNWPSRLWEDKSLCDSYAGEEMLETSCWREIVHPAYFYFNKEARLIFDFCEKAPNSRAVSLCKIHTVPEIAGGNNYDMMFLKKMCDAEKVHDPDFARECLLELVPIKMNFVFIDEAEDVVPFCISLEGDMKKTCFQQAGYAVKHSGASTELISKFCREAPEEYGATCRGQAETLPGQTYKSDLN